MENIKDAEKSVVTVGTFDGVHRGHKIVLETLKDYALRNGLQPAVVTFDRHPLETVAPSRAPRLLQSVRERDDILKRYGVKVYEVEFTPEVSGLTAKEWMEKMARDYNAVAIVTGYDNRFGRDGHTLSHEIFTAQAREIGLDVVAAPELPGICSSAIRKALGEGDIEAANEMLGRRYGIEGEVVKGRQLGRTIGVPTANLQVNPRMMIPAPGVYAAEAAGYPAVVNIGHNPTVGEGNPLTIEAHLIGFSGNLYGKTLRLEFLRKLREEKKFTSLDALKEQIRRDIKDASLPTRQSSSSPSNN